MNDADHADERHEDDRPEDDRPEVLDVLSETAQRFLDETAAADNRDLPDDVSGEEVPQDGDPGR